MIYRGRAWKFGDGISTDHIIPGRFYHLRSDLEELKKYTFADISPEFYKKVQRGDMIIGGQNFGLGSSREHAPLVIKLVGIDAVIAKSFARIFYRNAINVGLLPIICDTVDMDEGDELEIIVDDGVLRDSAKGLERRFAPVPPIMRSILEEGGLDHYIKKFGELRI